MKKSKKGGEEVKAKSAEVTGKEVIRYEPANKRLHLRIQIDGEDNKRIVRGVTSSDPAVHQQILDETAENMRQSKDDAIARKGSEEVRHGTGDWTSLPEGPDKQRIAQQAMREVVALAREGKKLQKDGFTRPEAYRLYASTRNYNENIWKNLDYLGTHVDKANYLALSGPGAGSEYESVKNYFDDLTASAPDWNAIATFMSTCTNPIPIDSPMTV